VADADRLRDSIGSTVTPDVEMQKPGDHPDFFRFPAPPGRSRESSIRLDASGRFWHDGAPVEHSAMAQAFASWIDLHPDDGRFILSNGYDWTYFSVDDVAFFVRGVRIEADSAVLLLSDGSQQPLDAATARVGDNHALYVRIGGGKFEARFTPEAQTALAPLLDTDAEGRPILSIGGQRHPVGRRGR
jgi:uncharacterized protein